MKRVFSIVIALCLVFSMTISATSNITVSEENQEIVNTQELTNYFKSKGVPNKVLKSVTNGDLESLMWQSESYGFSNEQVLDFLNGLIYEENMKFQSDVEFNLNKDGDFITPSGEFPNRYKNKTLEDIDESPIVGLDNNIIASTDLNLPIVASYTSSYRSVVDSSDQTGTYWVVKSETGYDEATAFLELPTINSMASSDRAYMFFGVNTYPSSIVGDYGVVYHPTNGWLPFSNAGYWNGSGYTMDWDNGSEISSSIDKVYLHVQVTNGSSTDKVKIRVLDADNFSNVLWTNEESFSSNPINSSLSNLNIYREITMAQINSGTLNTNTGSWFTNAEFSSSYIYTPSSYYQWGTSQTDDVYKKAPTSSKLATVIVNSYSKWYKENISIRYNVN